MHMVGKETQFEMKNNVVYLLFKCQVFDPYSYSNTKTYYALKTKIIYAAGRVKQ